MLGFQVFNIGIMQTIHVIKNYRYQIQELGKDYHDVVFIIKNPEEIVLFRAQDDFSKGIPKFFTMCNNLK
jgi:hypothetical protein